MPPRFSFLDISLENQIRCSDLRSTGQDQTDSNEIVSLQTQHDAQPQPRVVGEPDADHHSAGFNLIFFPFPFSRSTPAFKAANALK